MAGKKAFRQLFHELASRVIPICKGGGLSRNMQLLKISIVSRHVLGYTDYNNIIRQLC